MLMLQNTGPHPPPPLNKHFGLYWACAKCDTLPFSTSPCVCSRRANSGPETQRKEYPLESVLRASDDSGHLPSTPTLHLQSSATLRNQPNPNLKQPQP